MKVVSIIGGGLAGLTSAILLKRNGFDVYLFEEKNYPFHRVCGEYISNEVLPFLKRNNLYPEELEPVSISKFHLTSPSGNKLEMSLDLGGFGLSRYKLDHWLFLRAKEEGVQIIHDRILDSTFDGHSFALKRRNGENFETEIVIGAFGKRSVFDKKLGRPFFKKRSPYFGVKYHIATNLVDHDVIELHNFRKGYCGVSGIEGGKFNLCYLSHRKNLAENGDISEVEKNILCRNPYLKRLFEESDFLFEKPEVISEISFESKEPVFDHILMTGDAAGMIAPLCGNGMAMAIHSAEILSQLVIRFGKGELSRVQLEKAYATAWNDLFRTRLWIGRKIQHLFGASYISEVVVKLGKTIPPFARLLMKQTHGIPF